MVDNIQGAIFVRILNTVRIEPSLYSDDVITIATTSVILSESESASLLQALQANRSIHRSLRHCTPTGMVYLITFRQLDTYYT